VDHSSYFYTAAKRCIAQTAGIDLQGLNQLHTAIYIPLLKRWTIQATYIPLLSGLCTNHIWNRPPRSKPAATHYLYTAAKRSYAQTTAGIDLQGLNQLRPTICIPLLSGLCTNHSWNRPPRSKPAATQYLYTAAKRSYAQTTAGIDLQGLNQLRPTICIPLLSGLMHKPQLE
jgi:hypothetical protein